MPTFSSHVDVVVIGAGAAGLAAAQHLKSRGRCVLVLEASHRIGGRALTDVTTFSTPVDLGCAWLHQADRNPLTGIARSLGFDLIAHDMAREHIRDHGADLNCASERALCKMHSRLEKAISSYGLRGTNDASLSALLPDDGWAGSLARARVGELDSGGPSDDTSVRGLQQLGSTLPNFLVAQGMGRVVESLGLGLRIAYGERVTHVLETSTGVAVKSAGGTVHAHHCIVTVSTGILRGESIQFSPGLSNVFLSALDAMPMGHFNKVILEFDRPIQETPLGDNFSEGETFVADKALWFVVGPVSSATVVACAGGDYGRYLSSSPRASAVDEVLTRFKQCVGGLSQHKLIRSLVTDWSSNELYQGSYAYLREGGGEARRTLGISSTERIHFAGEATAIELAQTCAGAYLTGIATARRVDTELDLA